MVDVRILRETYDNSSWQGQAVLIPSPPLGPRRESHASPRQTNRVRTLKLFCFTCGFESRLPCSKREARCLKCTALFRQQPTQDNSGCDSKVYRESGQCRQSPNGAHRWKFGKCHYCQKAEGDSLQGSNTTSGTTWCTMGGKCSFKSSGCCKCGQVGGLHERNSRRPTPVLSEPSSRQGSLSPRPQSIAILDSNAILDNFSWQVSSSRQGSLSPRPSSMLDSGLSRRESLSPQPSSVLESHEELENVVVGGSLRAIRKLQRTHRKASSEHDDQSTSAGSDDGAPIPAYSSTESRVSV